MASHLLELSSVPNCKWTKITGKAPWLSLSWPGGGRAGTETWQEASAPAISHLPLLELDTHCCSFPYSLSKSLSTCKASDSSVSGAMTTRWKKPPRLLKLTPHPPPACSNSLSSPYTLQQIINNSVPVFPTNEVFDLGRRPLLPEGPNRQVGKSQRLCLGSVIPE